MITTKRLMVAVMVIMSTATAAMDSKNGIVDIRKFGLDFPHNKQDERKNTFWHKLAFECENFDDWSQVEQRMDLFKENNKNWMPNPLIENEHGKTARKEVKVRFSQTGNPVCGLLVMYLKQTEDAYLNKMALKNNRDLMIFAQNYIYPNKS